MSPIVFLIRLAGCLPLWLTTRLVYALAWISTFLPLAWHSAFRAVLVNLLICYPDKSFTEVKQLARRILAELAWTLLDCAHSWSHDAHTNLKRITCVHGHERLQEAMASERPVLLLSLHQSSWELPNLVVGQLGAVTVFYQPAEDAALNQLVTRAREGTGSTLVTADARGVKAALAAMKRGEAVAILADHNPDKGAGNPWVDFFGQPVRTSNLPFKLHERFRPRIFFACAQRVNGKVEAHFIEADASLYADMDEVSALTKMNAGLEAMINLAPAQYQWTYKRYHRTPDGKRPLYKKEDVLPLLRRAAKGEDRDALGLGAYSAETTKRLVAEVGKSD